MGFFKIFPAAAGIIALTATVSFARDQREFEDGDICRTIIANRDSSNNSDDIFREPPPLSTDIESGSVYHVEITRGSKTWLVSIDAYTGKILDRRESKAMPV
jgi:Peptidase propeptide and YPEB domain